MNFWKKVWYRLDNEEKIVSFCIEYSYKTEADMTLGVYSVPLKVTAEDSLNKGYVGSGDWKCWRMCNKIEDDIADVCNKRAKELLLKARNENKILQNNKSVWVQGKHVVYVDWSIGDLEWEPLTYDEYLAYRERQENDRQKNKK